MKKLTIRKGCHRPIKLIPACFREMLFAQSDIQVRYVSFTTSCIYDLDDEDQKDWNKLFGFCRGIWGVHKNSSRVVWRYNKGTDMIELGLYRYINGERLLPNEIVSVNIDEEVIIKFFGFGLNIITCRGSEWIFEEPMYDSGKGIKFGCGLYFGGNRTAPQDITIVYSKI